MANTIKIKRSAVQGKAPAVGDLSLGELALNTYDGKLYTLKNSGTSSVVEIGGSAFTGYITENTGDGTFWNVVTQKDVGYAANQVPLNQYLGQLAFLDAYSPAGLRRTGGGSDDVVVSSGGLVGIGTTNPAEKLDIVGNYVKVKNGVDAGAGLVLDSGSTASQATQVLLRDRNVDKWTVRKKSDNNFDIYDNNAASAALTIVTGGNVGIGTANPGAKLEVTGNITVSANSGSFRQIGAADSSNTTLVLQGGGVTGPGGNIELGRDGTNFYDANAQIFRNVNASSEYGRFAATGEFLLGTATVTGAASQLLQVSGGAYFSGNVGIGSTVPGVALAVAGSIQAGSTTVFSTLGQDGGRNIEVGVGSTTLDTYIDFGGSATYTDHAARVIRVAGDNGNFNIINRGTGNLRIVTQDAGPIDFLTTNTFRHRITSDGIFLVGGAASATGTAPLQVTGNGYFSGNVGIGTTNPVYKLEVNGDIKVGEEGTLWFSDVANSIEKIASTSGTIEIYADAEVRFFESDANVQKFTFDVNNGIALINGTTASGTANLQVTGGGYFSGSVGIGITTTSAKLEAAESASTGTYPIRATNTSTANNTTKFVGYELYGYDTVGTGKRVAAVQAVPADSNWVSSAIAFSTRLSDTVSEKVRIDSAGNVGIGSTSPNATLVVNGSARFFTASQGDVTITHSAFVSTIKGATGVQLVLGSNNTDVIRINNSSQVGIGTTNPVATLQVKDTLTFETTTTTTTSTSQVAVDTFAAATFRSAKYQVQVTCPGQVATLGSITNGGTGYTAGTFNVTFSNSSGTGAGAQGTVVISNGTVGAVGVGTTGGTGYTAGDVLTASGGSGFQVAVGTVNGSGTILTFGTISAAGSGYTAGVGIGTTTLTLLGGTGTGATATATINDGVITSSTLLQQPTTGTGGTVFYAGSNYTTSTVLTIAKTDVTNTIITIADSGGVSVFTSLTAHGVGVNDIVRVSSTANGLTAGTDYYVVTAPTSTTFTLGTTSGVGTTFTNGTSLSVGFYRNSAIAGSTVAYLNAISAISTNYQVSDLMVLHDGTTADYVEYATIATRDVLGTFAADISSSNARLLFTPTYATNTVKVARQAITL